ncbi:hypothetical protein ACFLVN_05810 [Chloroflexota bacterium]
MGKPDSQQRGLAGEYYVAFILTRLGYDIGITIGRAKIFDIMATGTSGKTINIQVKSTYQGYDWLVAHEFDPGKNSVVALVRLGANASKQPELYFLTGNQANKFITHKYANHSPRISRADIQNICLDHDYSLIERLLGD